MKKVLLLLLLAVFLPQFRIAAQGNAPKDSIHVSNLPNDSLDVDTLREIVVHGDTILRVNEAIRQALKNQGYNKISTKSVSDIIGSKATDMIMHPFAVKERKRAKKHARDRKALEEYELKEKQMTFEELLWEAIRQQAAEDGKEPPAEPSKK